MVTEIPRNAFNTEDGKVWIHEHGPRGGDELNILQIGGLMVGH